VFCKDRIGLVEIRVNPEWRLTDVLLLPSRYQPHGLPHIFRHQAINVNFRQDSTTAR
jgi:hypothetical protein